MIMNVLLLSVGTRNKIVQYFKKEFANEGLVVATDMSALAPAIYEADKYYIVPKMTDQNYLNVIFEICKKEKIDAVLSLIDPELSLLSKYVDDFSKIGVTLVGSSFEICERSLNKWKMFNWLKEHGYKCAKTYIDRVDFYHDFDNGKIKYPVFVKPICGSASLSISKVFDRETLDNLFEHNDNLMIQEFLNGQEIGVDVYIDLLSKEVVSIFTKKKIQMRAGETDKAVSFKEQKLFDLIERFVNDCGFSGQIDIDVFEVAGEYFISEVNPRFGGGYPHAYECGCNHISFILNNLKGHPNVKSIGCYDTGVCMMKYNEILIKKI